MEEEYFVPDYDQAGLEEDGKSVTPGPVARKGSTKRKKGNVCALCNGKFTHLHRHVIQTHLPWFFYPTTACWTSKQQFGQLNFLLRHLKTEHSGLYEEASFTREHQLIQWASLMISFFDNLKVSLCFQSYADMVKDVKATDGDLRPLADTLNSIINVGKNGELLHWRPVMSLLEQLSLESRKEVVEVSQDVSTVSITCFDKVMADSHFHLDVLLQRTGCAGLAELAPEPYDNATRLTVAVANYCWPKHWPPISKMKDDVIRFSVGIHPKAANLVKDDSWFQKLHKYASSGKLSAIGECGLDSTQQDNDDYLEHQHLVFKQQLNLAKKYQLPVVIHCRGPPHLTDRCLSTMRRNLDKAHKVHFHCFFGNTDQAHQWRDAFPNLVFGISSLILRPRKDELSAMVRSTPLSRLVLETDAPYLAPSPFHIPRVSSEVAQLKNLPESIILQVTARTTANFYGMRESVVPPGCKSE